MKNPMVLKFGGSSFQDADDYRRIADYLLQRRSEHDGVVAVVSAQPGETETFRERLSAFGAHPPASVAAGMLTLPDLISAYLLAAAVHQQGGAATVLPRHATGVITDEQWMWARIEQLDPTPLYMATTTHDVAIVAGGPSATADGLPTWMGKNSSDLAAVAAAINVGAAECEIYSDVEGIYTADPRIVPGAQLMNELDFITAHRMALRGAKVLHRRALDLACRQDITITCRLNRPPYQVGTHLSVKARSRSAVVIDLQSQLLRCEDWTSAASVHAELSTRGLQMVCPDDVEEPIVAVTGGYADVSAMLVDASLTATPINGRLVSVVEPENVHSHLAEDDEAAVNLGNQLHRELLGA